MSDVKVKMHQIVCRLQGLCSKPRWGSLQRSLDPLFLGPTSKGGKDMEREGKKGKAREGD